MTLALPSAFEVLKWNELQFLLLYTNIHCLRECVRQREKEKVSSINFTAASDNHFQQ